MLACRSTPLSLSPLLLLVCYCIGISCSTSLLIHLDAGVGSSRREQIEPWMEIHAINTLLVLLSVCLIFERQRSKQKHVNQYAS